MAHTRASESAEEEREFLAAYSPDGFQRPSVAVDVSLLTVRAGEVLTWLVRRKDHPHRGRWSLPGVFVHPREPLGEAAARALADKSGVTDVYLEQLYSFGALDRDPRTRVISVAYYALVAAERLDSLLQTRSEQVCLAELHVPWAAEVGGAVQAARDGQALRLAFDHDEQLGMAIKRIRGKLAYAPIGFQLLPAQFTLRELQDVHETLLGRKLNKDSFRRKMLSTGQLEASGDHQTEVGHRPAELYRFAQHSAV